MPTRRRRHQPHRSAQITGPYDPNPPPAPSPPASGPVPAPAPSPAPKQNDEA